MKLKLTEEFQECLPFPQTFFVFVFYFPSALIPHEKKCTPRLNDACKSSGFLKFDYLCHYETIGLMMGILRQQRVFANIF